MIRPSMNRLSLATAPRSPTAASLLVGGVIAVVAISAAAFGGVVAWLQPLLIVLAMLLGVGAVLRGGVGSARLGVVILAGFAALTALQLAPLPVEVPSLISKPRAESLQELREATLAAAPLSYYSPETRRGLAHVLIGIAVFAAVASLRDSQAIKRLLIGLFAVGILEACLAIAQIAAEAPGVYWNPALSGSAWVGSFVNHSNYAQLLNLSIGAGLGLMLVRSSEDRRSPVQPGKDRLLAYFQRHGSILLGIALQLVAVAVSLSRGGILGALFGAAVVIIALGRERHLGPRAWALVIIPVVAFAGLTTFGFDTVYKRLGTFQSTTEYSDRWRLSLDTARVGLAHPLVGTGLGTHRYVFPSYDTTGSDAVAEQADNDYVQLFEETGVLGVLFVLAFLTTLVATAAHTLTRSRSPLRYAIYGTIYSLSACAIQSGADFGQRLPAIFCLSAAMCGVVFAAAATAETRVQLTAPRHRMRGFVSLGIILVGGFFCYQAWLDYRAERWWSLAYSLEDRVRDDQWVANPSDYADLLAVTEQASLMRPHNVEYAFWLNAYRWQAFTVGGDPVGLTADPEGRRVAQQLVEALTRVRGLCPTYGPPYTLEGQIRMVLGDDSGAKLIDRGVALAPNDPEASYVAANMACLAEPIDREKVARLLRRSISLDAGYYYDAAALWVAEFRDAKKPRDWAGKRLDRLRQLVELLSGAGGFENEIEEIKAEADAITVVLISKGYASPQQIITMANSVADEGDVGQAILLYRQALAKNHGNIDWRLTLSDLLASERQYNEAYREARMCLRLKPGEKRALQRMEKLSLLINREDEASPLDAAD